MNMHKKTRQLLDNPDFVRRVNELVVSDCGETELAVDFLKRVTVTTDPTVLAGAAPAPAEALEDTGEFV